jgi:hypothetical protein
MNKQFFIFTDGSAIGNPGPAGWAAIVIHGTRRQEIAGSAPWSTVSTKKQTLIRPPTERSARRIRGSAGD